MIRGDTRSYSSADHKGVTAPKVAGDEYVVDAIVNITAYVQGGITLTAAELSVFPTLCSCNWCRRD